MPGDLSDMWNSGPENPPLTAAEFETCLAEAERALSGAAGGDTASYETSDDFTGSRSISIYVLDAEARPMRVLMALRRWLEGRPLWRVVLTRSPSHPWAIVVDRDGALAIPLAQDRDPLSPENPTVAWVLDSWRARP